MVKFAKFTHGKTEDDSCFARKNHHILYCLPSKKRLESSGLHYYFTTSPGDWILSNESLGGCKIYPMPRKYSSIGADTQNYNKEYISKYVSNKTWLLRILYYWDAIICSQSSSFKYEFFFSGCFSQHLFTSSVSIWNIQSTRMTNTVARLSHILKKPKCTCKNTPCISLKLLSKVSLYLSILKVLLSYVYW